MNFRNRIIANLRKYPRLKRIIKNIYMLLGSLLSDKKTCPSQIIQISDNFDSEHLFGYYDKSPWNKLGTKIVYLEVNRAHKQYASSEPATIICKDTTNGVCQKIAQTFSWNVQQGCMLQWYGDSSQCIIFNDFRDGSYCSRILNTFSGKESRIDSPIYSLARDGSFAFSLDFSRLNTLRPGYGYVNLIDKTKDVYCPNEICVSKIDIQNNKVFPLFSYADLASIMHTKSMDRAFHKVNHIMISPNGSRVMFLHRWIKNGIKFDRLVTCNSEGTDLYILLDEGMISHCNWRDDDSIIAYANTYENGSGYYLLFDKTKKRIKIPNMPLVDGHPSYSPDKKWIITDSYPNFFRKQFLYLYDVNAKKGQEIASIYSRYKYKNEMRCDLHPRWKSDGNEICFDGAQEEFRQVFSINLGDRLYGR